MIKFEVSIEDNDYLWDNTNKRLVKYSSNTPELVLGTIPANLPCSTAFPINLNEDVLEAIGFQVKNNAEYQCGNNIIKIDGTNPKSILVFEGKPVLFVSDIQNICRKKREELEIDETKLSNACKL